MSLERNRFEDSVICFMQQHKNTIYNRLIDYDIYIVGKLLKRVFVFVCESLERTRSDY